MVWMGGGTQRFDPNHWRQWDNSQSRSWDFEYHRQGWTWLSAQKICCWSLQEKRSRKYLSCNTWEQFFTLNRLFSWIFWNINLNFCLQFYWKFSLNCSKGGILYSQKLTNPSTEGTRERVCLKRSLEWGIYTDKSLINSNCYQFNSSAPLLPTTLSTPARTFTLLNIQEGCTLNKGCWITKETMWIMK